MMYMKRINALSSIYALKCSTSNKSFQNANTNLHVYFIPKVLVHKFGIGLILLKNSKNILWNLTCEQRSGSTSGVNICNEQRYAICAVNGPNSALKGTSLGFFRYMFSTFWPSRAKMC